jgi:hypothetical protein
MAAVSSSTRTCVVQRWAITAAHPHGVAAGSDELHFDAIYTLQNSRQSVSTTGSIATNTRYDFQIAPKRRAP